MMNQNMWMYNFQNQGGMPINNNCYTNQFNINNGNNMANNIMPNNCNNNFCFPNNTNQMRNMLNNIGMPMANNFFCGAQFQWPLNNMNFNNFAQNNVTNQQNIDLPKVKIQKLPEDSLKVDVLVRILNDKNKSLELNKEQFKNYVKQIMVNLNDQIKTLLLNDNRNDQQNKELDLLRFKMYKYSVINNFYFPSRYSYILFDGTSGYFPFSGKNHDEGEFRYWNLSINDFITFSKADMEELEDIKTNSNGKIIKHAERIKNLKDDLNKAKQENNENKIKEIEHGFDNCFPRTGNNNIGATCFFDSANMFMLMENPVFFKYLVEFGNRIFKRDEKLKQNGFNEYIWGGSSSNRHFINSKYIDDKYMFHKFKDKEIEKLIKSKYENWSNNEEHQAFHVLVALADYATALVDAQKEDIAIISPLYLANLMVSICNNKDVFDFLEGVNGVACFMAFDETGKPEGGDVLNCFKVLFDVISPTKFAPKFSVNKENIPDLSNYDLSPVARWQTESRLTESFLTNSMVVHNCAEWECVNKHKEDKKKTAPDHITHVDVVEAFECSSLGQQNNIRFTEILQSVSVVQFKGQNGMHCAKCNKTVDSTKSLQYNMFGGSNSIVNFHISNKAKPNKFKFPKLIKAGDGNYWAQISRTSLWGSHWKAITVPYEQLLLFDDFEYSESTKKNFGVVKEIDLSEASKLDGLECNLKAWYGYRKISEKNYNLLKAQYQQECQRTGLSTEDHIVDLTGTPFEVASENKLQINSPLYNFYPAESDRTQAATTFLQDLARDIQDPELNKIKVNDNEHKDENILNDKDNTTENDNDIENTEQKNGNEKVLTSDNNNELELNKGENEHNKTVQDNADINKDDIEEKNIESDVDQTENKDALEVDNKKSDIINEEKKDININIGKVNSIKDENTELNVGQAENENNLETNNSKESINTDSVNKNEDDANYAEQIKQDNIRNDNIRDNEENNQSGSANKENDVTANKENETGIINNCDNMETINEDNNNKQKKEENGESSEKPEEETISIENDIVKETEENDQNNDTLKKLLMIIGVVLLVAAVTLFALQFKIWLCVSVLITGGFTEGIGYELDKIKTILKRSFGIHLAYAQKNADYKQESIHNKINEINNNAQSNDTQNKTNNLGKDDDNSKKEIENEQ